MTRSASSAKPSSTTSSPRPKAHSRRWIRCCNYPSPAPPVYISADPSRPHSEKKDLAKLSELGHFLKGSSATLGLTKVKDSCEKIQNIGAQKDETGTHDEPDKEKCLTDCKKIVGQAKDEFELAEAALRRFYHDDAS